MPSFRLYNSLSKNVQEFTPREPGKVRVYNCGPTVYKRQHIGNMRRFLSTDFLRRTLEFFGYEVRDITNITDVGHLTEDEIEAGEDKLEKAAREAKKTPQEIANTQLQLFMQDIAALNIEPAHLYPRASDHIQHMQDIISSLLEKGHAYTTASGVYFDVQSFPPYGKLSGNTLDKVNAGARVEVRGEKKHPADFALWIFDTKQIQRWPSPWGEGYPGWHIECSAMSLEYLGSDIDIHTGGEDNRFPHHENEIAQSESATGEEFVRFWMHTRHLQLEGKKLSKREGEQITLDTLKEKGFSPLAFRLFVFSYHYQTKIDFTWEALEVFATHLATTKQLARRLIEQAGKQTAEPDTTTISAFQTALEDNLNTPEAWAVFLSFVTEANKKLDADPSQAPILLSTLRTLDKVVGVVEALENEIVSEEVPAAVMDMVVKREEAKKAKNFELADRLRGEILVKGYKVEDTPFGPRVISV